MRDKQNNLKAFFLSYICLFLNPVEKKIQFKICIHSKKLLTSYKYLEPLTDSFSLNENEVEVL